ncbi:MAG: MFS transporter [Acidobacteria bacterium]|nr:MFS transporter [Acidobacteriota bacterium]
MITKPSRFPFSSAQRRILATLATAVGMRMLGVFLVLPVFTLYGLQFTESRFLVGLAFGCYGLTMAVLQIPLGRLSDRIGRRNVLILGMSVFAFGSFLCAIPGWFPRSFQIFELMLGRLIQGGGAIISTAFAAVADHVEPENRSFAMAFLGIPIGAAFILGVIGGPFVAGAFNTESLFWLTGLLGLGTVFLLKRYMPSAKIHAPAPASLGSILTRRPLQPLVLSGFLINFFMTSFFFYFPLIVTGQHQLKLNQYYILLLPMLLVSGITTFVLSWFADRGPARAIAALLFFFLLLSAGLLFRPELAGFNPQQLAAVLVAGIFFFVGFSGLEPILPSLVSKSAPEGAYGTSLGLYNTGQFLGSFAGASVSGAVAHLPSATIMAILVATSLLGFLFMVFGPKPAALGGD